MYQEEDEKQDRKKLIFHYIPFSSISL
jgi:hypothetical protein